MSDSRRGSLTEWGTLIATAVIAVVGYLTYVHRNDQPGEQRFSVPVNTSASNDPTARKQGSLEFQVKKCGIEPKLVSCSLTVTSPRYDRRLTINFSTHLVDGDGDRFNMSGQYLSLPLDRDQTSTFKLAFAVNKDVVRPLAITLEGSIDQNTLNKQFQIQ
jgi:hypothetical protein